MHKCLLVELRSPQPPVYVDSRENYKHPKAEESASDPQVLMCKNHSIIQDERIEVKQFHRMFTRTVYPHRVIIVSKVVGTGMSEILYSWVEMFGSVM